MARLSKSLLHRYFLHCARIFILKHQTIGILVFPILPDHGPAVKFVGFRKGCDGRAWQLVATGKRYYCIFTTAGRP